MNRKDAKQRGKERFRSVLEEGKQNRENTKKDLIHPRMNKVFYYF